MSNWFPKWSPCGKQEFEMPVDEEWDDDESESNPSTASKDLDTDATLMDVNTEVLDVSHKSVLAKPHPPLSKLPEASKMKSMIPKAVPAKIAVKVTSPDAKSPVLDAPKSPVLKEQLKKIVIQGLPSRKRSKKSKKNRTPEELDSAQTTARRKAKSKHRKTKTKSRARPKVASPQITSPPATVPKNGKASPIAAVPKDGKASPPAPVPKNGKASPPKSP